MLLLIYKDDLLSRIILIINFFYNCDVTMADTKSVDDGIDDGDDKTDDENGVVDDICCLLMFFIIDIEPSNDQK